LVDGVSQLKDGSMTLTEGLEKFKKEGVDVLVDAVDGDVKGLVNRLKAISQVSANYKSYSGISSDMDGKVDFIYKTDGIEE
jgi:putative membrane protein